MHVAVCRIELQIPGATTLKDKRRVVHSIKDRVAQKYRVSIAEVGRLDNPRFAELGVACVSNDVGHATSVVTKVGTYVEETFPVVVLDVDTDIW